MEIDPFKDPELTYYEPIPCMKRFKRNFRMLDLYALPVTFRFKGEKKFYTNFGAASSLVLLLLILGLLSQELSSMVQRGKAPNIQLVTLFSNTEKDKIERDSGSPANFIFSVRLFDKNLKTFNDSTVIDINVQTTINSWSPQLNQYLTQRQNYSLIPCDQVPFFTPEGQENATTKLIEQEAVPRMRLDQFTCPQNLNSNGLIGGQPFSDQYNFTSLIISKCQNSTTSSVVCKTPEEIKRLVSGLQVQFNLLNTNFQGDEKEPLQGYVESFLDGLKPDEFIKRGISLSKNMAYRYDSYYLATKKTVGDPLNFLQTVQDNISSYKADSQENPSNMLEYRFVEYPIYTRYSRTYLTIIDVMISIGGTWTSLSAIGLGFNLLFSYNLMMSSLIRRLYYFKAKFPGEIKKKKKDDDYKPPVKKEISFKVRDNDDEDNQAAQLVKKAYAEEEEAKKTGKAQLKGALKDAFGKNRAKFDYLTVGVLKYYCCCRIIMSNETLRKKEKYRNDLYFNRGLNALNKEFDVGYIIKQLRTMRYFLRTVLEKDQRILLKLKKQSQIESADDASKLDPSEYYKRTRNDLLIDRYCEQIQKKEFTKQDARLFEVIGANKALKILTDQRKKEAERVRQGDVLQNFLKKSNVQKQKDWESRAMRQVKMIEERKSRVNSSSFSSDSSNSDNQTKPQKKVQWQTSPTRDSVRFGDSDTSRQNNQRKPSLKPSTSHTVLRDSMMPFENLLEPTWSQNIFLRGNNNKSQESQKPPERPRQPTFSEQNFFQERESNHFQRKQISDVQQPQTQQSTNLTPPSSTTYQMLRNGSPTPSVTSTVRTRKVKNFN